MFPFLPLGNSSCFRNDCNLFGCAPLVLKDLEDGLVLVSVCVCVQEWWTHLWLNEGFASWIEYLCVDHCFPEYDIWTQFVSADYTRALDLDALDSSHPIEVSFEIQDVCRESLKKTFCLFGGEK